jgi:hypothetical protein
MKFFTEDNILKMNFFNNLSTLLVIFAIIFFHFHHEKNVKTIPETDDVMGMEIDASPIVDYYVRFDTDCYLVTDILSKKYYIHNLIDDLIVFTSDEKNDILTLFQDANLQNETIMIVKYFDWNTTIYFENDSLSFFIGTYMIVLSDEYFQIELLDN